MNKTSLSIRLAAVALTLCAATTSPSACAGQSKQAGGAPSEGSGGRVLSKKTYSRGGAARRLTLQQIAPKPAPPPSPSEMASILSTPNSLKLINDLESFNQTYGDVVFAVVDSPAEGEGAGNLIGAVYAYYDIGPPVTQWSGDIVIDKSGGDPYVILARSRFPDDLTLAVYRVSPAQKVADFPYTFDRKNWDKWPKPPAQFSEWKTEAYAECGFDKLEAEQEGRTLVVRLAREGAQCSPTTFRFDTETKTWSGPKN